MKKKIILLGLVVLILLTLTGCVSRKKRAQMFDMLKENGCIEVGDRQFDEYDKEESVDMSPVPAVVTYYTYEMDDSSYVINYGTVRDGREDVDSYKAVVATERDGKQESTTTYIFENRKIFWLFWKMYYIGER